MPGTKNRSGRPKIKTVDPTPEDGIPEKPAWLTRGQAKQWDIVLGQIHTPFLRQIDGHLLATLAILLDRQKHLSQRLESNADDDTCQRLLVGNADRICKLSVLFGASPLDRKRFGVEEDEEPEPIPSDEEEYLRDIGAYD